LKEQCLKSQKVIKGKAKIAKAIDASEYVVDNLLKIGLPAVYVKGTLYSHIEAIEMFFKTVCIKHRGKELLTENAIDSTSIPIRDED
jgi:hypothetical protein